MDTCCVLVIDISICHIFHYMLVAELSQVLFPEHTLKHTHTHLH